MMLVPPAAPVANMKLPSASSTIVGDIELSGRFPGTI